MVAQRFEVRLDDEHRRTLEEPAAVQHAPASAVIRGLIDRAYEEVDRAERLRAARELAQLAVEDVPDPETLNRQLAETYGCPDLS